MCLFSRKLISGPIKAPITKVAKDFMARCKHEGKNLYDELRKMKREGE